MWRISIVIPLCVAFAIAFPSERLCNPDLQRGWASLIATLLVVSGIQLVALGVIGEYLGRLFLMGSGRPQLVVRERVNCDDLARGRSHVQR